MYDRQSEDAPLVTENLLEEATSQKDSLPRLPRWTLGLLTPLVIGAVLLARMAPQIASAVPAAQAPCTKVLDFSGSLTDDPAARTWFTSALASVLEIEGSSGSEAFIAYGNSARPLAIPQATAPPDLAAAVASAMGTREWGDPLAGFELAAESSSSCVVHITDGTIDLPPTLAASPEHYREELLALADRMTSAGTRVLTIALVDAHPDVWREIAVRTGGAYLVNPDSTAIDQALRALAPTVEPTQQLAAPAAEARPTLAEQPGRSRDVPFWMAVAVPSVLVLTVIGVVAVLMAKRPRLSGWLEGEEEKADG